VTVLNLGVIDQPYVTPPAPAKPPAKKGRRIGPHAAHAAKYTNITTGEVANILEAQYHIMEVFWHDVGETLFEKNIYSDMGKAIRAMFMGAPFKVHAQLYQITLASLEVRFKQYLANSEIEKAGVLGVPTQAALDGVSHRFKSGINWAWATNATGKKVKAFGVRRPSFIDTGLYQSSFKSWVDF